ncbi:hypothetical protein J1N35_043749 [Gossypium stocksii]|uniref:PPM-type phosphatase domain-containing protein n=1 Tax=Gossypium stocksii TaxID=47602 RepID=A0A9D3U843_9ROSI|nr:hypothetical protein J1N35_043749 [Gossypium stocksii]
MEDYHVAKFIQIQRHELGLFSIYDGHLGDIISSCLKKPLFPNILKKTYEKTNQAILSQSSDLGRGGPTVVTAKLINAIKLCVKDLRDSRVVLSRRGQTIQTTIDHEPNIEQGNIKNIDGFISNMSRLLLLPIFRSITEVPDLNTMFELYDPSRVMFFFIDKHIMIDIGTGSNNKIN